MSQEEFPMTVTNKEDVVGILYEETRAAVDMRRRRLPLPVINPGRTSPFLEYPTASIALYGSSLPHQPFPFPFPSSLVSLPSHM